MAKPEVQVLKSALADAVAEVLLDEERGELGVKPTRETVAGAIVEAVLRFEVVPLAVAENLAAAARTLLEHADVATDDAYLVRRSDVRRLREAVATVPKEPS